MLTSPPTAGENPKQNLQTIRNQCWIIVEIEHYFVIAWSIVQVFKNPNFFLWSYKAYNAF